MKNYHRLAVAALILAVIVIMLGAYTRLTDGGLGCPDWPGCYGRLVLPNTAPELAKAQKTFPEQPIVAHKAWSEMVHRYVAGTLGTLIIILAVWALVNWRCRLPQPMVTPFLLLSVLIFQAVLGMWTVTLKLLPLVVSGHLLGGMAIAGLLSWLVSATSICRIRQETAVPGAATGGSSQSFVFVLIALLVLVIQLFLGAWTSTNYAALACGADFPGCQGALWPAGMDWAHAFNILSPIGPNYEGGRLTMMLRVTIQMAHRYWAVVTFIYLGVTALWMLITKPAQRAWAVTLLILLCVQVGLGILNVVKLLPLGIAVAHNGVAVLLLITLVTCLERSYVARLPRLS